MAPIVVFVTILYFMAACEGKSSKNSEAPSWRGKGNPFERLSEKFVQYEHKLAALSDTLEALEEKLDELQENFDGIESRWETKETEIDQTLTAALQKHGEQLQSLQETYSTPTVLFTAKYLTTNHYSPGDVFVFPNIVSNIGEGYNQSSGYFTAPYTGVYIFTTTICSQRGKHVFAELIAAIIKLEAIYTYNGDGNGACVSFSGVAKLSKGERAWVRGGGNTAYSGALHSGGSYRWPTFSGMLVHVLCS